MTLLPKLKVDEHVKDDELPRSSTMFQHNTRKKITEKQQISSEKIRRRIKMIERQLTHLNTAIEEHKKKVDEQDEMMSEHARLNTLNKGKRRSFLQLDTQTRIYQVPLVDDQKLKSDREEIQRKVEEYEDISKKVHSDSQTVKHLIQELESLKKEITDSKLHKQQRKLKIESRFEEIQRIRNEFINSTSANDMLELQDNIEDLHENIEKWAERFQNREETVSSWMQKNNHFEDSIEKLEDNVSLRDQKASDIEEHISFLNLMLEVQRKMADHKENMTRCKNSQNIRKQQKEELLTPIQKIDYQQTTLMTTIKGLKEKLEKTKGGNINFYNANIKPCLEDIKRKVNNIEELGKRIEKDRGEISESEQRLEAWDLEIEQKCQEISCPEISSFKKEHTIELNDLCAKLDRWNTDYRCFVAEHDQWLKKKNQLDKKVKTVKYEMEKQDEQAANIDKGIICLHRMIDTEEKIKQIRKLRANLIDLEKQKKDIDLEYLQKKEECKRNVKILQKIRENLRKLEKNNPYHNPEDEELDEELDEEQDEEQDEDASNRLNMIYGETLCSLFSEVINSVLSIIDDFIARTCMNTNVAELMEPSNFELHQEKERIEQSASQIEEKYEEMKQKNEKLSGDNNETHIKRYMDKIEHLFQEVCSCESDITKAVLAWGKEKDKLEKNVEVLADEIKNQIELICNMESRAICIHFMLDPEESMVRYRRKIFLLENQIEKAKKGWINYMNEYGQQFDRINKNKGHLVEILNGNRKYMYKREEVNQSCDYTQEESGGHKEEKYRNVEEAFRTIFQLTEKAHVLIEEGRTLALRFILLDSVIWTRYKLAIRPLEPTKEEIEMRFKEIDDIRENIQRCVEIVQNAEDTLQKWADRNEQSGRKSKGFGVKPFQHSNRWFSTSQGQVLEHDESTRSQNYRT